ncbi:MAG: penicillin-binding protein 1C [Flavobacteriales bacterium]|nr:penicillin-binding protein 1C [Flavobacteriales bacterium]MCB9447272.1 penicillin-binding protein 1C [Flavobacteriales bacterium]
MAGRRRWVWRIIVACSVVALYLFWTCLPEPLFDDPVSTVIEDTDGHLMGARIAADGQWRFPPGDSVPEKFRRAIICFEDKRFYRHPGVDPLALARAIKQNLQTGHKVSGGSTLSMQVIRLSRKGKSRTIWEKAIEICMAIRLELRYSKTEILGLYASHAPFGGNVVGLEAASWRYFGRSPDQLSWAESSVLAVLPNAPSLLFPGRNKKALQNKRDRLLQQLQVHGDITAEEAKLAALETTPNRPLPLPHIAQHLLNRIHLEHGPGRYRTHVQLDMQLHAVDIVERHGKELAANGIYNAAVLIADVNSGDVKVYIGNEQGTSGDDHGRQVDVIPAGRSTGSVLKPFLYASMLTSGDILPNTLVPDIPINIGGYAPTNFDNDYRGAVPAHRALAKSLNIPAVLMLQQFGIEKFHHILQSCGITTLNRSPQHYGLSIILGGAEASLWDLAGAYASMARTLNHFRANNGQYDPGDYHTLRYLPDTTDNKRMLLNGSHLSAGAIWTTFNAMLDVERPEEEGAWREFASSRMVAWKTGTSLGFRDGWAIGVTPDYVVGVWTGNADGEGRPELIGLRAAAPILFDLIRILPHGEAWFDTPWDDLEKITTCKESGYRSTPLCGIPDTLTVPKSGVRLSACPYHRIAHITRDGKWQVHASCEQEGDFINESRFVLPPAMEWYYKKTSSQYQTLPPYRSDCLNDMSSDETHRSMELVYPRHTARIFVPRELDGNMGATIFKAAHREADAVIYWYLDQTYLGKTSDFHQMAISPPEGKHVITLVDQRGEELKKSFEIIGRDR